MPKKNPFKKKVAIVIPTHKETLKKHEKISLDFLERNLKKYDKFLVVPESFNEKDCSFDLHSLKLKKVPNKYFGLPKKFNSLLHSSYFYKQFKDYDYILMHQIDCLVFKDELEYFCSLGYDYIGAPFIKNQLNKIKDKSKIDIRNGGFFLGKVSSFIEITEKYEKMKHKNSWFLKYYLDNFFEFSINRIKAIVIGKTLLKDIFIIPGDIFWSIGAKKINPLFKVAPFDIAISFAFENNVPLSFKMNNNKLPFGCHAFQHKKNLREWKKLRVFDKPLSF